MADVTNLYDAIIIGGGPAGLTAALYLARARYRVLVVEKDHFGGQITITAEVVNYPGVLAGSGTSITDTMRQQAEAFGAEFMLAEVTGLDMDGDIKRIKTSKGELECFAVLLATGASPRMIGFKGEAEFKGHGVAYCATCDGEFFTDKQVFVVGGGFAAAEEAVFLTKYASHVTILVRGDDFSCAPSASEPAKNNEKIDVFYNTEVVSVEGESTLRKLTYKNNKTGEIGVYEGDGFGVFVFAGYAPATELVQGIAEMNDQGYIVTDETHMSTCDGLFAAGDVCVKQLRQVATAVGEAAAASTDMERYCKRAQEKTGLVPERPVSRPKVDPAAATPAPGTADGAASDGLLFDESMLAQLNTVFERMAKSLVLRLYLDDRPVAAELEGYMSELVGLTDKLSLEKGDAASVDASELPFVEVCSEDGTPTGLAFHGVPGGHEFTGFVLGLYNAAGPGQPIDDADRAGIAVIKEPVSLKVLVGLSCTMCPEVVLAAQRIAADNTNVTANVYDINHFEALKDAYNVMSVPCLVVEKDGEETVSFGKKNLAQVLELVG